MTAKSRDAATLERAARWHETEADGYRQVAAQNPGMPIAHDSIIRMEMHDASAAAMRAMKRAS